MNILSKQLLYKKKGSDKSTDFIFEIKTDAYKSGNTQFYLPINNATYINPITVDWGDGNQEVLSSGTYPSHTYSTAGTYEVRIHADSGKMPYLYWYGTYSSNYKFSNRQLIKVKSALMECYRGTDVANFSSCFSNCTSLMSIPQDLFRYNTAVSDFTNCFLGCYSLTTIPQDLFRYNTAVTSFSSCFYGCTNLQLNPNIFCDEATEMDTRFANVSPDFTNCFFIVDFTGAQGTAPQLWRYTYKETPEMMMCFFGHSTTSLTNYNDIPSDWK